MTDLEKLEQKISDDKIDVFYETLAGRKGASAKAYGLFSISLDKKNIANSSEERCVLAHEYAHIKTNALYTYSSRTRTKNKMEYQANVYMVHELVSHEQLDAMLHKECEIWEIAEELSLPEECILLAINIYQREGKIGAFS